MGFRAEFEPASKYYSTVPMGNDSVKVSKNTGNTTTNRVSGFKVAQDIMLEHQRAVCTNGRFASGMKSYVDDNGNKVTKWFDQNKKIISESIIDENMIMTTTYYREDGTKASELRISDSYPFFRGSKEFDENGNLIKVPAGTTRITKSLDFKF